MRSQVRKVQTGLISSSRVFKKASLQAALKLTLRSFSATTQAKNLQSFWVSSLTQSKFVAINLLINIIQYSMYQQSNRDTRIADQQRQWCRLFKQIIFLAFISSKLMNSPISLEDLYCRRLNHKWQQKCQERKQMIYIKCKRLKIDPKNYLDKLQKSQMECFHIFDHFQLQLLIILYELSIDMQGQKQWAGMQEKEVEQEQESYINENFQIKSFQFSDMDQKNKKVVTLSAYDPNNRHRSVYPGLNLQGICRNQICKAFEKMVWVPRHYGSFHIGTEIHELTCPICQQQVRPETIQNLGYTRASISVQGKKVGSSAKMVWEDKQTEGNLVKFDGYEGKSCQWLYLKIIAKEI